MKNFHLNLKIKKWEASIRDYLTTGVCSTALHLIPDGGTFVDIGANTGLFSEIILKEKKCKAFLFEPIYEYYHICKNKFLKNKNVKVENYALSNEKCKNQIWMDKTNLGWNTMIGDRASPQMKQESINSITFDDYFKKNKINKIDLIKIDVEGYEYKVLNGMRKTLQNLHEKPVILLEIGFGYKSHPFWNKEVEEFEWLIKNGYERFNYQVSCTKDVLLYPADKKAEIINKLNLKDLFSLAEYAHFDSDEKKSILDKIIFKLHQTDFFTYLYNIAGIFLKLKQKKKSGLLYSAIIELLTSTDPGLSGKSLFKLALITNDKALKKNFLKKCIKLYPEHQKARDDLKKL